MTATNQYIYKADDSSVSVGSISTMMWHNTISNDYYSKPMILEVPSRLKVTLNSESIVIQDESGRGVLEIIFTTRGLAVRTYQESYIPKELQEHIKTLMGMLYTTKQEIIERAQEGFLLEPDTDEEDVINFVKDLGINVGN